MDWHYSDGKQQFGPVSEEEFNRMVTSGVIGPQTLVWRAGMENWQPYGQLTGPGAAVHAAAAPLAEAFSGAGHYCAECGHKFPDSDLIQYQEAWVCGNCKPIFFQKLREGMPVGNVMVFAGFWVRFGAKFIDNIILNVVGGIIRFAVMMAVGGGARGNPATLSDALADLTISLPLTLILHAGYNIYFLGKQGATPGKSACHLRVVTGDGLPLTYGKATARYLAELVTYFTCLIGYIMAAFDDQKRTLHDRICDTRVIKV